MTRLSSNAEHMYQTLISTTAHLPDDQQHIVRRAHAFAERAYEGRTDRFGAPMIAHPLRTATILAQLEYGSSLIIAGLLHAVPNTTNARLHAIASTFGYDVGAIVDGVSDIKPTARLTDEEARIKTNEKLGQALINDQRVAVLRVADMLDTLRHPHLLLPQDRNAVAEQALRVESRLARAIGRPDIALKIESLCYDILGVTFCASGVTTAEAEGKLEQARRDIYNSIVQAAFGL